MGCDTLGPRGDEKNGCHGDWLAYCASLKKSSQLSSFRSNRFNNLFASAAGLVYHQQDILHFFLASTTIKPEAKERACRCFMPETEYNAPWPGSDVCVHYRALLDLCKK